ncbi:peptidoglycan-binding protein [Aurantimonas endophytica]|uniref:Putative chitinase n=1 Tax=Aurantimonas endophytica TaxID=1522175 RepID=A0A7W6H9C9_9HYPH|nr:peptidoglycan-binding protein [Aurantimonas endophytica]MBB4000986.1 putative chitinase [Aurantimonas endophytica]
MRLTLQHLSAIAGGTMTADRRSNMQSILAGLAAMGVQVGLDRPQRLSQYLPQLAHESGRFRYDVREDLGNTPARDGDGKLYMGRSGIQVTGGDNYRGFRDWCWAAGLPAPDFEREPDKVNTDPWEGLAPIWYWSTRNLNRYADEGNIEMVTRRINGGTNGYADRLVMYERTALVLLGRKLEAGAVRRFQEEHGLIPDDIAGPQTRGAMHDALGKLPVFVFGDAPALPAPPIVVPEKPMPAPVVVPPTVPTPAPGAPLTAIQYLTIIEAATADLRKHYGA